MSIGEINKKKQIDCAHSKPVSVHTFVKNFFFLKFRFVKKFFCQKSVLSNAEFGKFRDFLTERLFDTRDWYR